MRQGLTIKQLETLREVMRTGSMSAAASSLLRAQPSVSAMIASLEEQLGFLLFEREGRKIVPTPEAHFVLEEAEAILGRLEQMNRTLKRISALELSHLKIATYPAASDELIPSVLVQLLNKNPGIRSSILTHASNSVYDLVASQKFDAGLAETLPPRETVNQKKFNIEFLCAVPADSPLAQLSEISPVDLDGMAAATLYHKHPITKKLVETFEEGGYHFSQIVELQTFSSGLKLVEQGVCYMICDRITAYGHRPLNTAKSQIVFRPFKPELSTDISILTPAHRPLSLSTKLFIELLSTEIKAVQNASFSGWS
ncbi:LysR family transcriptional regulator [Sulfitobacter sp. 20_GPM-1509m]|uniref:LysR family transcriptional regulator n=1 Tax=Sulfitobacter sp. 20_GPM-1509m TaxID=1380367 RepID=UPI0005605B80|nr:LysR family transcriptional regulator [Sulfitobacter sp. 20_GPM-1509m]